MKQVLANRTGRLLAARAARLVRDMTIRLAEANRAIEAVLVKAHHLVLSVSVTVCDARLVALQRMDGAFAEACRA